MPKSTSQLRRLWQKFECAEADMVVVPFGPDRIRVAPPTAPAWDALARVMDIHGYEIRTLDTDSYNCRTVTGGTGKSLHAYGIALDVNWTTNPFQKHTTPRAVRFSSGTTQSDRAFDVRQGRADTDMTPEMIADVERIATVDGVRVFEWGGSWTDRKDCMHFELDLGPDELARGIDPATIAGGAAAPAVVPEPPPPGAPEVSLAAPPSAGEVQVVIARSGLRLRSGATRDADVIRTLPEGTRVWVLERRGEWALVDLEGDGRADGFVSSDFLRGDIAGAIGAAVRPAAVAVPVAPAGHDVLDEVTVDHVAAMFPVTPRANITRNLPFVLDGLRRRTLGDRPMVLMALATIRAETEGFLPISEGQSRYNTQVKPFDLYEPGTPAGSKLGNTERGDGARFKGRGYVQLTGRDNYTRIGRQVEENLVDDPERANDPTAAGIILAQFLKNREDAIRAALAADQLKVARRLVNGGSHGFDRFADAYRRGLQRLPA